MTTESETSKRGIGRRILWVFRTTFISLLLIVILGGLAWAAFLGSVELKRSFNSISARIEANKQRIALLNDEVARLSADDPLGKIDKLRADANDLDGRLTEVQVQVSADLDRQSALLTALQEDVAAVASSNETAVADTAALGDAIITLQNDINESSGRIDSLGGEIDSLRAELAQVDTSLGIFTGTAVSGQQLDELQQTLALFQVWERIARARLYLSEDNLGLAASDVERAVRLMDLLTVGSAEVGAAGDQESLELVQARLALAFNSLPDDPGTAVRDLENAWSQLDAILTARLFPEGALTLETAVGEESGAENAESEAETTPTPAPAPTATPSS